MHDLSDAERGMLQLLYELSKGDKDKILNRKSVTAALGPGSRDGEQVLKALTARRMIRYILFGSLCLTEAGLVAAQRLKPKIDVGRESKGLKTVRILFLASNPETSTLDLEEELRSLESELRGVRFRDEIVLTKGHAVRPDDLVRLLREERPTIVHFSGHGSPEGIVLRADSGHLAVPGESLVRLFRDRDVQLVVLNACFSENQASLLRDVVSAVVGTTDAVGDEAARRFSTAFYRTLGDGHLLKDAFRDGGDAVAMHALDDVFHAYGNLEQFLCGRGEV